MRTVVLFPLVFALGCGAHHAAVAPTRTPEAVQAPAPAPPASQPGSLKAKLTIPTPEGWIQQKPDKQPKGVIVFLLINPVTRAVVIVTASRSEAGSLEDSMKAIAKDLASKGLQVSPVNLSEDGNMAVMAYKGANKDGPVFGGVALRRYPEVPGVTLTFGGMWATEPPEAFQLSAQGFKKIVYETTLVPSGEDR